MLKEFLETRATLKALNRIATALERIARVGEESVMGDASRSVGLRSWYIGDDPEAGTVIQQTDEEFAQFELDERKRGIDAAPPEDEPASEVALDE